MHKRNFLFLLLTSSVYISSQEYNETYLKSLPDDIRKDVLERMDEKKASEEVSYRFSETVSDLKKTETKSEVEVEEVFGEKFFQTMQTSFMPINMPNMDDDYILGYGDVLKIQLTGQKDLIDSYIVARDGSINIPDIGKINLSGLSLDQVSKLLKSKVNQAYTGTDVFISLEALRDISVLLAGDAYNPGVYTLNGNSNMLHALHVAGGIGEYGSYRTINLIRNNQVIQTLDIYDILINGKYEVQNRLRSGDIIFVAPRSNVVSLEGAFKRPHKYELLPDQNLYDAIIYANGTTISADFKNTFLYRILDAEVKSIPIVNIAQFKKILSVDQDRLFIRENTFRDIKISGAVVRPGNYKMLEGENIFDLIEYAGGYTINAFPEGAVYLNKEAEEINRVAMEKLYSNFIEDLLGLIQRSNGEINLSSISMLAEELKNMPSNGRVIVDLMDDRDPFLIKDGDSIIIPEKNNNVFIFGEVNSEGALKFEIGANIDFYLDEASGLKDQADLESIFIMFPNGRTKQLKRKRSLFASQSENIIIQPGSIIYVPKKIDDAISSRLAAQAYATILGNVSIALASLKSIND